MPSKSLMAASLKPFILSILAEGSNYGYQIIKRVSHLTDGHIKWTTGTLYPLLHTLENDGFLESYWEDVGPGPDRKYYRLTEKGHGELARERTEWLRVHRALLSLWGNSIRWKPIS